MLKQALGYIFIVIALVSYTHAVVYLDDIDQLQVRSQLTGGVVSGATTITPSSQPTSEGLFGSGSLIGTVMSGSDDSVQSVNTTMNDILIEPLEAVLNNPIDQLPEIDRDAEFLMSLRWLYEQGITKFNTPDQYKPDNYLSRVDAAKMLSILSKNVFNRSTLVNSNCEYSDIEEFDDITKFQVTDACQLGIFRTATVFNPNQGITKGQLITVLIRMFDGKNYDESIIPRYKNYVLRGNEIGLLTSTSTAGMDEVVSRLDVAKLLYKLRNIHLNKLPINESDKPFIHIVNKESDSYAFQALIDVDMIRNDDLKTLEMKLDTVTYYYSKTDVYNYGTTLNNFQVYGYIYASSDSITAIGVGTRRVQGGVIQEGNLVIRGEPQTVYNITPNREATIYMITKK